MDNRKHMPCAFGGISKFVLDSAVAYRESASVALVAEKRSKRKYRSMRIKVQDFYAVCRVVEFETKSVIGLDRVSAVDVDGHTYPRGYNVFVNGVTYRVNDLDEAKAFLMGLTAGSALARGLVVGKGLPNLPCEKGARMMGVTA